MNNRQLNGSQASSSRLSQQRRNQNINSQSFRGDIAQTQQQIRSLQTEIEFTICNYESILETQKKNTSQRNQFLLYLIQSMKQKHNQELQKYQNQLASVLQQKQQASSLQSQMKNIGDGVDTILQEGKKLKQANQSLVKELQQQTMHQRQIDQQIEAHNKEIQELRTQVDQWQVKKLKWNRKKKDMVQMIQDTENNVRNRVKVCKETGVEEENCQHCENQNMKKLMSKYQQHNGK